MFGINLKAVSLANVSKRSTRWRLSSAADANTMEAVAVAHKGIVDLQLLAPQKLPIWLILRCSTSCVITVLNTCDICTACTWNGQFWHSVCSVMF